MPNTKALPKQGGLSGGLKLAKDYFLYSNERTSALLLLLGVLLSITGLVVLTSIFAWWNVMFWTALNELSVPLYIESLEILGLIIGSYMGLSVLKDYLISNISIQWGTWLKKDLIDKYTVNYLKLGRHYSEEIPNVAQRIQEDSQSFVDQSLWLSIEFVQSLMTQATFLGTLWVIGGALSFSVLGASITIPGYLVWSAILFAIASSFITHHIGRVFSKLSNLKKEREADFRKEIESLSEQRESIAQDHGGSYYNLSIKLKLQQLVGNAYDLLRVKIRLTAFNAFYQNIAWIFPYIVAAPLYFAKKTSLGQLMQVGFAFGQVQTALSWFANSYEPIASYEASIERIMDLESAMLESNPIATPEHIQFQDNHTGNIEVCDLKVTDPSSDKLIMQHLSLEFKPMQHTLIKGGSGMGKSTFFKVLAGTWNYGSGVVHFSSDNDRCFLPQKPVIQDNNTLAAVLAYPDRVDTYKHQEYEDVLRKLGNMDDFIDELNHAKAWSKILSGGQQQRISFGRVLLKKPRWIFLDEVTSALDDDSENTIYGLLKTELPDTTFVSIAHKESVTKFHDRVIEFKSDIYHNIDVHEIPQYNA